MFDPVATTIAFLALVVSGLTAWLTLFRTGTIRMTQPTVIYVGPDGSRSLGSNSQQKVYLRTLLFATSKRGRIIESMHVFVSRNETKQNFNIWVHGEDKLVRGSGLFVGETGVSANHHFLPPKDADGFRFSEGSYTLKVYATLLGEQIAQCLWSQSLQITREHAEALRDSSAGLYFDWGPDSQLYIPHVEKRPPSPDLDHYLKALGIESRTNKPKNEKA